MIKRNLLVFLLLTAYAVGAQPVQTNKYPSLLWEITGNGLAKPSYLFGTMHVSSKLAFHLSDSFYYAIKNVDAVALELNPDVWQGQMVRLDQLKENYGYFAQPGVSDFMNQSGFRIRDYGNELKIALQSEPAVANSLLYRSYKIKEDFEEDTFLDMYIFQTGRKLGKSAAGVENYFEAEKLVLEAYADMAREKKKKTSDLDAGFMNEYAEKLQDAYRRGDLDLMDSLDNLLEQSPAFREKFMYRRNEIQANSIDSIIRHKSLFAGVGAAHLPGSRGVIELLRKKGYKLRPVKMADKDGLQKNAIDSIHVPVQFQKRYADDGFYSVDVPGELYNVKQDYLNLDRRQFADMSNGSYYLVTRIRTHAAFLNQPEKEVLKRIDSLLYENIPGKILSKKEITKNGYSGYDISNRTRRGDLQRYQVFATPFEIVIFKMSGKENYVSGSEAEHFFSSISLKERNTTTVHFEPAQGGFSIRFPQLPSQYFNNSSANDRWEYEAVDEKSGDAFLVFKKSLYNFNFLDEDSFYLQMMEESFRSNEKFDKQLSRKKLTQNNRQVLEVREQLKNGDTVQARFFINGPDYYVVATTGSAGIADDYLNSFSFRPYRYGTEKAYTDTFLHITVQTPVVPEIDNDIRSIIEKTIAATANGNSYQGYIAYWQKPKYGLFRNDSTGELVQLQVQELPRYYFIQDSAKFWSEEVKWQINKGDMYISEMQPLKADGYRGMKFILKDTGSSRMISHLVLLKNNFMYKLSRVTDSASLDSGFGNNFFSSLRPVEYGDAKNIYESKLPLFFNELFSTDSATFKKAQQSIANVRYGVPGIPLIMDAIRRLNTGNKDYYNIKSKLIAELGYIRDSTSDQLVTNLYALYRETADTALFQNEVIKALSRIKTKASYLELKKILVKDPPIFETVYDYNSIFSNLDDSLQLSTVLFPEIMQLSTLDDYKEKITNLLVTLVDSGLVKSSLYEKYLPGIYIDAVVAMKKQKAKDEKKMQAEAALKISGNDEPARVYDYNKTGSSLNKYAILLMPFYDKDENVKDFFSRLLQSKDDDVRMNTAVLMIRGKKLVADSILMSLAANDKYRFSLYKKLEKAGRTDRFPGRYKNQLDITRSSLVKQNEYDKLDSIVFVSKIFTTAKEKTGFVYCYKYRVKPTDKWRIAMSGLQPADSSMVNGDVTILSLSNVKLKDDEPVTSQFDKQLKKILFSFRRSGRNFFDEGRDYLDNLRSVDEYSD